MSTRHIERRDAIKTVALAGAGAVVAAALPGCGRTETNNAGDATKRWGMIIDLERCIACKSCVVACKNENKTPPGVAYSVVIEEEHGTFPHVWKTGFFRPCMQCSKSSCAKVCPTGATHCRSDGIIVIDYENCIGCRYCIAACPYGARLFDYGHDFIAASDNAYNSIPSCEYNSKYGIREKGKSPIGNVRKCSFCLHLQNEKGQYREPPSCARTCMGKAIHFGDLKDPEAKCLAHGEKMQELLARRGHYRLKEELGNEPNTYYLH